MAERIKGWGLQDSFRTLNPEVVDRFSWFDYRSRGFEDEPRRGLRIDYILTTHALHERVTDCGVDYDIRAMEAVRPLSGLDRAALNAIDTTPGAPSVIFR